MAKISSLAFLTGAGVDLANDVITIVDMSETGVARNKQITVAQFIGLVTDVAGLLDLKGSTDCSANPNYPAASKGDLYVVSVAGKIGGASGPDVEAGDSFFALADNAGGTHGAVGSSWAIIQTNTAGGGGAIAVLDDIGDVDVSAANDGDVLTRDASAGLWVPMPADGGGGGAGVSGNAIPSGRLTLVSATPVLNSDQTAKTAIYYTPFRGNTIPIYDGTDWNEHAFSELTLNLDTSNHLNGSLYDVFIWNDAGTIKIGAGPAWASSTSRGTGGGTTEIEMQDGIWSNANSITLTNGAGAGSAVAANRATYVGSFYCTANGQTGMAFKPAAAAGGTNNILGVYNAYNRVPVRAMSRDSTASWSYNSNTWRAQNNSNSNRISFVDGLQGSSIQAKIEVVSSGASTGVAGVNLDSTSAAPDFTGQNSTTAGTANTISATGVFLPQLGFHYVQACEATSGSHTFSGAQATPTRQSNALTVELDM